MNFAMFEPPRIVIGMVAHPCNGTDDGRGPCAGSPFPLTLHDHPA
jgi:hypothetical protein